MKIFPSKSQWAKWSLPSKASYFGVWIGCVGILVAIIVFLFQAKQSNNSERPMISIISIDSYLDEESMETKFSIKNVGGKPAFVLIKAEASIDGKPIQIKNVKSETQYQTIMPDQKIGYRGLTIKGITLKMILNGTLVPEIFQKININYGSSQETIGEYRTFQCAKLNVDKLVKFKRGSKVSNGIWLLESSDFK
jgi:hypothetical protein